MTITEVLRGYLTSLSVRAKPSTVKTTRCHVRRLDAGLGPKMAAALGRSTVEAYAATRLETGVSRATVNGELRVLRAALSCAVENRLITEAPCRVRPLKEGRKLPRVLTPQQVDHLVECAAEPWVKAAILLAARAGLRHQEILHLQWARVEWRTKTIIVAGVGDWTPKSHHEREVPFGRTINVALTNLLPAFGGWVFPWCNGTLRSSADLEVRATFKAAGLYNPDDKPGLHMLRRTWATELLGRGADIETVRQLGGWADLSTVQRYVTSTDERKRAAIALLEDTDDSV